MNNDVFSPEWRDRRLGPWLTLFVVLKVLVTAGQVLVVLFLGFIATRAAAQGEDWGADLAVEAIWTALEVAAVVYGLTLLSRRDARAPWFWSTFLIVSVVVGLFSFLALDDGLYSLFVAAHAAAWQVYWRHSRRVRVVFR